MPIKRWGGILAAAFAVVLALVAPASAQLTSMRMGIILPVVDGNTPPLAAAVANSAEHGAMLGADEAIENAEMLGVAVELLYERASGADAVAAAAQRLRDQGAFGIIGGFGFEEARALGVWAEGAGVPFVNVGAVDDSLRNDLCSATTFHIEASAAMYLDALAGWYVRAGFRRWFIIQEDSESGDALYERLSWTMENRHFGAREVGHAVIPAGTSVTDAIVRNIDRSNSDLVILLSNSGDQLTILADLDARGVRKEVLGFPWPDTQTRAFYLAYRAAAPNLGAGYRASSWEWTIDAYGAREYNARYADRFNEPMDAAAWATFHAVKTLFEAAFFGQSIEPANVMAYMTNPASVFDLHKGIAVSFRPWDRQIRQSLFLIKIRGDVEPDPFQIALLVGELPAIYMPGTDPIERLDQLGDLANQSTCRR
ncbi:MAG: ABC transporter substrate-binding protein [Bauldia sp.]